MMSNPSSYSRFSNVVTSVQKIVLGVVIVSVLVLILAWMGGAFHDKVAPGSVSVERSKSAGRTLVKVESSVGMETVTVVGSVQPRRKTDVASQLLASIREIKPRPGDKVKAGDLLIALDDRELLAQQREAVAAFASNEADLVTRRADYERVKSLRNSNAISVEEFSRIEGAFRISETQVKRAKEAIGRIEVLVTYTKILANSDGLVAERFAEPGDLATPGKPLLSIYDPNDLELQINVPESLAFGIAVGQKLPVRIDASNIAFNAAVREIVPQAQQASRSVLVKVAVPQMTSSPLLPGMFGRASIPVGRSEKIWAPSEAVQQIGQLDLVEVADKDGFLTRRFVRLGQVVGDKVEILSGLTAGDQISLPAGR